MTIITNADLTSQAVGGTGVFDELMTTVRVCSLGQIVQALHKAGGEYRRNM
jgi:methylmalonyl-CoA mutase